MREKLSNIKLLILDVDGTLTDGGVYVTEDGKQFKKYNAKDGLGIKQAIKHGIEVGIISHSMVSEMVVSRANSLGIRFCYVGHEPKLDVMKRWCEENGWAAKEIAYIGDDINDLEIMKAAGITACPSDSLKAVKEYVDFVLQLKGGEGCVREFIDEYLLNS